MSTQEPRKIAFEDIKKGDDIEARYTRNGVTYSRRGIAHEANSHRLPEYWYAEAGGLVASNYDGDWKHFLHSRPAPEEPKGLGAVVRATTAQPVDAPHLVRTLVRAAAHTLPWVDGKGIRWEWSDFDPDSIEVLSEGIEVES